MDTRYGKYDGPLSALADHWMADGGMGSDSWSDADLGEGSELFRGSFPLTYRDARYLADEHDCTTDELDALADELDHAAGVLFSWDSQGFLYAESYRTPAETDAAAERIAEVNARYAAEEG